MSATRRKFSLSKMLYQLQSADYQAIIHKNFNSRIFDNTPETFTIFDDVDDDLTFLLPTLVLIPVDDIEFNDRGCQFTQPKDIQYFTEWTNKVMRHAANVMLTADYKIKKNIRDLIQKSEKDLTAHDIMNGYIGTITMMLQMKMKDNTTPDYVCIEEESASKIPVHPFEKHLMAFHMLVTEVSSQWVKKHCDRQHDYTWGDVGIGVAITLGAIIFGAGVTAVAVTKANNDNSHPRPGPK